MASKMRLFTKGFFVGLNILVVVVFLLACLAPYLNPQNWWIISILGLAFPFILLFVLIFFIWWLFLKRRLAWISGVALILGIKSISVFFAFNIATRPAAIKKEGDLRVATWNVARFIEMKRNNNAGSRTRLRMLELINAQNPDILCMQEFFHSTASGWYSNLTYISKRYNYPYYYYSHDDDGDFHFTGSVIFSRFPIIDSGLVRYPRPSLPEALMYADIKVNNDTIRVYTTHLQSLQLNAGDYDKINRIKDGEDGLVENSKSIFSKLKRGVTYRKIQSDIISKLLEDSPHPKIFCGDLNDVPNSYTYFNVRGEMQDAFLKKGFGIGRTFNAISPTLRIDYIFADDNFTINRFRRIVRDYSDHYMLVSDLSISR